MPLKASNVPRKKSASFMDTTVHSAAPNLEELSLIVNRDSISSKAVRRITECIRSEKLKSLTIAGVDLQEIIRHFEASIKKLTLKYADFDDFRSFIKFIVYIKNNFVA